MRRLSIELANCRFHSFHGVLPQERKIGNEFIVDLKIEIPADKVIDDKMESSISYADLYEILKDEMSQPRNLLETVASKIADRILQDFPEIIKGQITVCKATPPVTGICGEAKVSLSF